MKTECTQNQHAHRPSHYTGTAGLVPGRPRWYNITTGPALLLLLTTGPSTRASQRASSAATQAEAKEAHPPMGPQATQGWYQLFGRVDNLLVCRVAVMDSNPGSVNGRSHGCNRSSPPSTSTRLNIFGLPETQTVTTTEHPRRNRQRGHTTKTNVETSVADTPAHRSHFAVPRLHQLALCRQSCMAAITPPPPRG